MSFSRVGAKIFHDMYFKGGTLTVLNENSKVRITSRLVVGTGCDLVRLLLSMYAIIPIVLRRTQSDGNERESSGGASVSSAPTATSRARDAACRCNN